MPLFVVACSVIPGCAPRAVLAPPANFPQQLGPRKLYHTPQGVIYANGDLLAGETDRWLADVSRYVKSKYNRPFGRVMVIAVDAGEAGCTGDFDRFMELRNSAADPGDDDRPTAEDVRKQFAESGLDVELGMRSTPLPLDALALDEVGLGRVNMREFALAMSAPSNRLILDAAAKVTEHTVRTKMIFAYPLIPMVIPESSKIYQLLRDTLAFQLWARQQPDWDSQYRSEQVDRFMDERALYYGPLLATALKIAKEKAKKEKQAKQGEAKASQKG